MLDEDFRIVARRLALELETVRLRAGGHPGELGGGAEGVLRNFLQSVIPRRYSVGSGFIRDTNGGRSQQMDVVINDDTIFAPLPYDEGRNLYLGESVAAVIQVKTRLDPRNLNDSLTNLASAARLRKKPAQGEIRILSKFERSTAEIVRSFVFAFEAGTSLETLRVALRDFYGSEEIAPEEQASMAVVLNVGIVLNFPPGWDKGVVMQCDRKITEGVVAMETRDDTLLLFLTHLLDIIPKVIFRHVALWEYVSQRGYAVSTDG